jgi:hypothetical protein
MEFNASPLLAGEPSEVYFAPVDSVSDVAMV